MPSGLCKEGVSFYQRSYKITGAILLAVGLWGKFMLGAYISIIADSSTNAPYVLIGTGTCIIYAMFLSLVFLAELVAGISGFVFRHEDERSLAVDNVQRSLKCCGVLNYTSWLSSIWFPNNGIPPSCCANISDLWSLPPARADMLD
ncbi:unnamed protein product [Coregonus sp. 'balchen']|nr:unnamed protein product [Coregonus sp. 'balchen']